MDKASPKSSSDRKALRPLALIVTEDATLAAWHARLQRENLLTAIVRRHLPRALADRVRVAETGLGTLTLVVAAGAVAAVIRQRTPDLLSGLRHEGWDFTELRLRVQVGVAGRGQDKPLPAERPRFDSAPLRRLACSLSDGPLKRAVLNLARRAG